VTMTVDSIRVVLGRLQDDPESEAAWEELAEIVTAPGTPEAEYLRLLEQARARFERRREWLAVARLLEMELSLSEAEEPAMQAELARILDEELLDSAKARAAHERLLELDAPDALKAKAKLFLQTDGEKRAKWSEIMDRLANESDSAQDDALKAGLLLGAADVGLRYGGESADASKLADFVERAVLLDSKVKRGAVHAEVALNGEPKRLVEVLRLILGGTGAKDDRVAAGIKAARILAKQLSDRGGAVGVYEQILALSPGQPDALAFLAEAYNETEQWDQLVALYEEQLKGGIRGEAEQGISLQIAMVHWKRRGKPDAAEPHFDRLRKSDPTNGAMLAYFREHLSAKEDHAKLATILGDAQRAASDPQQKKELGAEIAKLAESSANAQKAIEQYKAVLKVDPNDPAAREALKRLYSQAGNYPALVDLLRHDVERLAHEDKAGRIAILREIAAVHREHTKNEQQLVQILQQIIAHDEHDQDALRELVRIYEPLNRMRDLLTTQQRLAEITSDTDERVELYRSVARRWAEQFSNVQNAISAYEKLIEARPTDEEGRSKLRELYTKRRSWAQLYALHEIELKDAEGSHRIELLAEMAKLAAERLDRGADAIAIQRQILDLDPSQTAVFEALEKQTEREKDYAALAEVLEKRIDWHSDVPSKLALLQKLGPVYSERLKDHAAATKTWKRVLELSPGQAKALRVLRESYVASGDYDALEELYSSQNDWDNLADFLSSTADKITGSDGEAGAHKVELSFRAAAVYETKLGAPERATRSYERVLTVETQNARAAKALVPIYEKEERWARLPALYEILLAVAADKTESVALLRRLGQVTGGPLADKASMLSCARRAYELVPDEENLEHLEAAARASSSWGPFVEALERRLASKDDTLDAPHERKLRLKLATAYARELGKIDEAVAAYRALVQADPSDSATIADLDELLRGAERREDLRWLFGIRTSAAAPEDRARIFEEWAMLEEDVFGNPKEAIELYRKATDLDPSRRETLRALSRLLLAEGHYQEAASVVARHRDLSEGGERAEREVELATLAIDHLASPVDALAACERALELRPRDSDVIAILTRLSDEPATRARAAVLLQAVFADLGDARREAQMLRVMIETTSEPESRLELHVKLANVEADKQDSPGAAFDVVLRVLNEFPSELALWDLALDLSRRSGRPTDLSEAYRAHIVTQDPEARTIAEDVELVLCDRAANLHDQELGDSDGAVPYLKRILGMAPTNQAAFDRLKQILTSAERWGELEELFDQAARAAADAPTKINLLNEVAMIAEEVIGNPQKAIFYHERILEIDSLHAASLDALEKLYEDEERYGDLAALLERRLETAIDDEAVDIRLYLGRLYLEQLLVPDRALHHIDAILKSRPEDADARELAERMLEIGSLRLATACLLEGVYEARDEVRPLVRMLEIRLESSKETEERRELLRRIGELRDERLHDDAGAFDALAQLCPMVPDDGGVRERLTEIGRRLNRNDKVCQVLTSAAEAADNKATRAEILMQVAALLEGPLGDTTKAEEVYRQLLQVDPDDVGIVVPAARALSRLQVARGAHDALAETLEVEAKLEESIEARKSLYERLGDLYETNLGDPKKAIRAWRARLADDDSDEPTLSALERLYEHEKAHADLVEILMRREAVSTDAGERKRALVKAAKILSSELEDEGRAATVWRNVLDSFGADRAAHAALAKLHERAGRHQDLADVLEADLALSETQEDQIELYRRLGDVRRVHLKEVDSAIDSYRFALNLDPNDQKTRAALESMLEDPDARRSVTELLHPLYEADGDAEKLLKILDIEAEVADTPGERIERIEKARATCESALEDPKRACEYARRAMKAAVQEDSAAKQMETLERLTAATGSWEATADLYRQIEGEVLDGDVQHEMLVRIGQIHDEKLGHTAVAIEYFQRALEGRPGDRRVLLALEALHAKTDDNKALLDILEKREDAAESDEERKDLMFRRAAILRDKLHDPGRAIEELQSIIELDVDSRAATELSALYTSEKRFSDLVVLYERMLETSKASDAARLRVKIARIARTELLDSPRAFDELEAALGDDAGSQEAIGELESILGKAPEQTQGFRALPGGAANTESREVLAERARAAEMLEPVYRKQALWSKVQHAIEARLVATEEPSERAELLKKLAMLLEEQLDDFAAAMEANAELLHQDIDDRAVWAELERLAKASESERRLAEIYARELAMVELDDATSAELAKRTGQLFAEVGEDQRVLEWYRRAHKFEPEDRELYDAIDAILVKHERHQERATLMKGALDYREGGEKSALLHLLATLEEEKLDRIDDAIETYKSALDVDPQDERAKDRLTGLYARSSRFRELADLYQLRADSADSPEQAAPYRLALSRTLREKLDDKNGALEQLEAIVSDVPSSSEAVRDLERLAEDQDLKARVIEILRPIAERANDWRQMVKLNQDRLVLATDRSEKAAIHRENATILEANGLEDDALQGVRAAFLLEPEDTSTLAEFERLSRKQARFEPFAAGLQEAIASLDDDIAKRELYATLAKTYDRDLDDPRRALAAYETLAVASPDDDDPKDAALELATLLGDWTKVTTLLEQRATDAPDPEAAALLRRLGQTRAEMLLDQDGAIKALEKSLDLDAEDKGALDRLIALYEEGDASTRLVELYARRIELATPDEDDLRYALGVKSAEKHESLGNPREAIVAFQAALSVRATDRTVLKALERLYRAEQLHTELLDNLRDQAGLTEDTRERAELRLAIGDLYKDKLDNAVDAVEQYRLVLEEAPDNEGAIRSLSAVAKDDDGLRLDATDVVLPVLRRLGKHEERVAMLELRLSSLTDPELRADALREIGTVLDENLGRPEDAVAALLRAVAETPDDDALHSGIEAIAGRVPAAAGFAKYADVLFERATATLDPPVARALWVRLGTIAEEKLSDDRRASEAFQKALAEADAPETELSSLVALDRLYTKLGDNKELSNVLERRVAIAPESEQAELHFRMAKLSIHVFGEPGVGLGSLKAALGLDPNHAGARDELEKLTEDKSLFDDVAETLEGVYRQRGDTTALSGLYEKRIANATSPTDRLRLRLDLARVLEDQANDPKAALQALLVALEDDPSDSDVLGETERVAGMVGGFEAAAAGLEKAIRAKSDLSSEVACDLWMRAATWRRDKLSDNVGAEKALEEALKHDPQNEVILRTTEQLQRAPGRERELVGTLRRLANLDGFAAPGDLRREAKSIAEGLGDDALSEEIVREMLKADEADAWALAELTTLRRKAGATKEVYDLLVRRTEVAVDGATIASLRHEAALVARGELKDLGSAIELYDQLFEDDPNDERASLALRELYQEAGKHKELKKLLERLVDVADSPQKRNDLRLEAARVSDQLEMSTEAIELLTGILDEDPTHKDAALFLSRLYEKAGRDEDLAELLQKQIEVATNAGDGDAELSFRLRLGEVQETRIGDLSKAADTFQSILDKRSDHKGALVALARISEARGDKSSAAKHLERLLGLEVEDDAVAVAKRLATLLETMDDEAGVERILEKGLELRERDEEIRGKLRALYEKKGSWEKLAELHSGDARVTEDVVAKVRLLRSAAELRRTKLKDSKAAAELLQEASQHAPQDRDLLLALCDAYSESGRGKQAAEVLQKIVESYGGRRSKEVATIHHRLARAYLADGEKQQALTELDTAFRIDPGSIHVMKDLGILALALADESTEAATRDAFVDRASRTFRALLMQKLDDAPITKAEVFYHLGDALHRKGETKQAIHNLERALDSDKNLAPAKELLAKLKG
jgi:golgin subfamily B member 1